MERVCMTEGRFRHGNLACSKHRVALDLVTAGTDVDGGSYPAWEAVN